MIIKQKFNNTNVCRITPESNADIRHLGRIVIINFIIQLFIKKLNWYFYLSAIYLP